MPVEPNATDNFLEAAARLRAAAPVLSGPLRKIAGQLGSGDALAAQKSLKTYLSAHPEDTAALELMAKAARQLGRRNEAACLLSRCLEISPRWKRTRFNYAKLLFGLNRFSAALEQVEQLRCEEPENPLFRELNAHIFSSIGENGRALKLFEELAEENPKRPESWLAYGHALRMQGSQSESIMAYRRAIQLRESCGLAWWALANMKTVRFTNADLAAMQEQLNRADLHADDRATLQYALGKAREDRKEYGVSFAHYAKANAAMRLRADYDPETLTKGVAASKRVFTWEFFESRRGAGCTSTEPIFVVGRPRSGSTLVEQILCSHSAIEGTAELPYIAELARAKDPDGTDAHYTYPEALAELNLDAFADLGREYLRRAALHRKSGRPLFIDKAPANYFYVGLIHLILPNAKIIDVRRHPLACSLSIFKQFYTRTNLRLSELGRFYRDYVELMAHFDCVLPGRTHRLFYEDMVAAPEKETRRLLDYLGVPFEEDCLRFYETERTVLTPSSEQVRRPISGEAVDHWRNFEPWLRPLVESLGSVANTYPSVPAELSGAHR